MDNDKALMLSSKELYSIGKMFIDSGFFGDIRQVAQAAVKIQAGRELGFGPFASMKGINIIRGRVELSANLMGARIKSSGKYDYRVKENSVTSCEIEFLQKNGGGMVVIGVSKFTMTDAANAQIASGDNWKKYPRNMLFARAMSNGAKWFCPDLFSGAPVYAEDEIAEVTAASPAPVPAGVDPETGEVKDVTPPTGEDGQGEQEPGTVSIIITSPDTLLTALCQDPEMDDYFTRTEGRGASIYHVQGAIRKYLANPKWSWPRPADAEGWRQAKDAATEYAKAQIALSKEQAA